MISVLLYSIFLFAILQQFSRPLMDYLTRVWVALHLPGPSVTFPFGNCFTLRNPDVLNEEFAKGFSLYGAFGRIWLLIFPVFVIMDPKDIQMVLGTKKHTEKIFLYKFLHNFLGKGLITSERERWHFHRKYLQPYFHLGVLEKFIQSYENCAKRVLVEQVKCEKGPVNITYFVNQCVLSVLNGKKIHFFK